MDKTWLIPALFLTCCVGVACADVWVQTDWEGGDGQQVWNDSTKYSSAWSEDGFSAPGELKLRFPGWECTGELAGAKHAWCLLEAHDGSMYAGTYSNGDVFRSTDGGANWMKLSTIPGASYPWDMVQASDDFFYATSPDEGLVFFSMDSGVTWLETGQMPPKTKFTYGLLAPGNTVYVGAYAQSVGGGRVYKSTDKGATWDTTAYLPGICHTYTLFKDADGAVLAGGNVGYVDWTTNGGQSWSYHILDSTASIYGFTRAPDGSVYMGTYGAHARGHVWKATNRQTWEDLGFLSGLEQVRCVLAASDGSVYAGGVSLPESVAYVYRTTDGGFTWVRTGDVTRIDIGSVSDLIQTADGTVYAAGDNSERACVFKFARSKGWVISSAFDAGDYPLYGAMCWSFTTEGDSPAVKVRTDTVSDMSGAFDWSLCPSAVQGQDISLLPSVHDGQRFVQYRIEMEGWDQYSTPSFHEISIEYTPTGIDERSDVARIRASQEPLRASPSVFRTAAEVRYTLYEDCQISLSIRDVTGRCVKTLAEGLVAAGDHSLIWNGSDIYGRPLPSGLYFCTLAEHGRIQVCKTVLVR